MREKGQPRLFRFLLQVADLEQAVVFYTTLLGMEGRAVGGGRCYFDCGDVILGLVDISWSEREAQSNPEYVYFAVSNLGQMYKRAKVLDALSGEKVHGAPAGEIMLRPWGERSFYVIDPYGNRLCFVDADTLFTGK